MRRLGAWWLAVWLVACSDGPLPELGLVPDFELRERSERPIRTADLDGSIWIANFIFTRCPDVCPRLTHEMAQLVRQLAPTEPPRVRFVSIAVDPAHDTPEALRAHADRVGAPAHWWFLTGSREVLRPLLREGFHVAWGDDGPPTAPITHTDRFVLVDRQRQIRGYYHGTTASDLVRLAADAQRLSDAR